VLDGYWYESGTKFKGKVMVDDRLIEDVTMMFNIDMKVMLKGEKKSTNFCLLVSESGDTQSGKLVKGRIEG